MATNEGLPIECDTEVALCEICEVSPRRYKCPRCSIFTCSLTCCRSHKQQHDCSGIRDRAAFVSNKEFSERHLRGDFHFLEDVLQTKVSAKRTFEKSFGGSSKRAKVGKHSPGRGSARQKDVTDVPIMLQQTQQRLDSYSTSVRKLFTAAKDRGTQLVLLPNGMTRRMANSSYYNTKKREITWKIFICFVVQSNFSTEALLRMDLNAVSAENKLSFHSNSLIGLFLDRVPESMTLFDVLGKVFDPKNEQVAIRYALRKIRTLWEREHLPPEQRKRHDSADTLQFLMHKVGSPSSAPIFVDMNPSSSLGISLKGQLIIEYPVLIVGSRNNLLSLKKLIAVVPEHEGSHAADTEDELKICDDLGDKDGGNTEGVVDIERWAVSMRLNSPGQSAAAVVTSKADQTLLHLEEDETRRDSMASIFQQPEQLVDGVDEEDDETSVGHGISLMETHDHVTIASSIANRAEQAKDSSFETVLPDESATDNEDFLSMVAEMASKDTDTLKAILQRAEDEIVLASGQ